MKLEKEKLLETEEQLKQVVGKQEAETLKRKETEKQLRQEVESLKRKLEVAESTVQMREVMIAHKQGCLETTTKHAEKLENHILKENSKPRNNITINLAPFDLTEEKATQICE